MSNPVDEIRDRLAAYDRGETPPPDWDTADIDALLAHVAALEAAVAAFEGGSHAV